MNFLNVRTLAVLSLVATAIAPTMALAGEASSELKIDIPVQIKKANVVFNMDHMAFAGDQPIGLKHMKQMLIRFEADKTKHQLAAIFHGDAGFMLLDDTAYNAARSTQSGNPYKSQIQELMGKGVNFEECGATMKAKSWVNKDLIPGVKVNAGANLRLIQLQQQGYFVFHP